MVWHTTPKDDAWKLVTVRSVNPLCQNLWLRCNRCDHEVVIDAVVFSERSNVSFDTREANREPAMIPPKSKRWRATRIDREEPAGLCGFERPHPGTIMVSAMAAANNSTTALAAHIGVSRSVIVGVIRGRRGVTADLAAKLGKAFASSAQFWLNLQNARDLWEAERRPEIRKIRKLGRSSSLGDLNGQRPRGRRHAILENK